MRREMRGEVSNRGEYLAVLTLSPTQDLQLLPIQPESGEGRGVGTKDLAGDLVPVVSAEY